MKPIILAALLAAVLGSALLTAVGAVVVGLLRAPEATTRVVARILRPIPFVDAEGVPRVIGRLSEQLRELVSGVAAGAVHIQTGSSEIAQAAEDLARRTESTAATLEQTAAAVGQMDERLRATSTAAERSVRQADDTSATVATATIIHRIVNRTRGTRMAGTLWSVPLPRPRNVERPHTDIQSSSLPPRDQRMASVNRESAERFIL